MAVQLLTPRLFLVRARTHSCLLLSCPHSSSHHGPNEGNEGDEGHEGHESHEGHEGNEVDEEGHEESRWRRGTSYEVHEGDEGHEGNEGHEGDEVSVQSEL